MQARLLSIFLTVACCVAAAFPCRAADNATALVSETRPLLHTFVQIKTYGRGAAEAVEAAFAEMERINDLLNNYDPRSEVSRINQNAGGKPVAISRETMDALRTALRFGDLTGGALDITIGPLVKLWGFAKDEPGLAGSDPDAAAIGRAKSLVNYRALELDEVQDRGNIVCRARLKKRGMWIDVGAFSKGYVADMAMAMLCARGCASALVSAGGTVCVRGVKPDGSPWTVAVRHPRKDDAYLTFFPLRDAAISTSGDYERFYEKSGARRSHIIDPRSGMPVERMQSVSVIAPRGVDSDALSTAIFVLGEDRGIALVESLPGIEALVVTGDGRIVMSQGWPEKTVVY